MAFPKAKRFDYKYSITPAPTAYEVNTTSLNSSSVSFSHSKRFDQEAAKELGSTLAGNRRISMSGTIFTRKPPRHSCIHAHPQENVNDSFSRTSTERKSTKIPQKIRKSDPKENFKPRLSKERTFQKSKNDEIKEMVQEIKKELENCQSFLKSEDTGNEFCLESFNLREQYESTTDFNESSTSNYKLIHQKKSQNLNKNFRSLADFNEQPIGNNHNSKIKLSFTTNDLHKEFKSLSDFSESEVEKYFSLKNNQYLKHSKEETKSNSEISDCSKKDKSKDVTSSKYNTNKKYISSSDYIETDHAPSTSDYTSEENFDTKNIFKNKDDFKNSSSTFDISEEFMYDDYQSLVEEDDLEMTMNLTNYEFSEVFKQFTKLYYNGSPLVMNKINESQIEAEVLDKTLSNDDPDKENKFDTGNSVIQHKQKVSKQVVKNSGQAKLKPKAVSSDSQHKFNILVKQRLLETAKCPKKVVEIQKPKKLVKKKPTKSKTIKPNNGGVKHNQTDDQKRKTVEDEIEQIVRKTIEEVRNKCKNEINQKRDETIKFLMKQIITSTVKAENEIDKCWNIASNELVKNLKTVIKKKY